MKNPSKRIRTKEERERKKERKNTKSDSGTEILNLALK